MANKTLILTGWGHPVYSVAAALALQHYGEADIRGISKGKLPEFLENVSGYTEIAILGVGLTGDAERLGKVLAQLRKHQVKVLWISIFDFPKEGGKDIRALLDSHISRTGSLLEAVAEHFHLEYADFDKYLDDAKSPGKEFQEFRKAAEYYHRNYHQEKKAEEFFCSLIRRLADDPKQSWKDKEFERSNDVELLKMRNHYRRFVELGERELQGKSAKMENLKEKIRLVAPHDDVRVLILGESGTGKETVAQQILLNSGLAGEPFIAFSCTSVNPNLLESRFLGHRKGAYTGADKDKKGLFEEANGGTLFLDEIGELPLDAQVLLLRVLQEGKVRPVGEDKEETKVNVRVIAATNRDLPQMVREGKFRLDLYYRLCTVQLHIPPLKEHLEDIADIAYSYRKSKGMDSKKLSAEQIEALMSYEYPGNVRELLSLLERAHVLGITDYAELLREHKEMNKGLFEPAKTPQKTEELPDKIVEPQGKAEDLPDDLKEATRLHVKRVYEKYGQNITTAARALGLSRNTVRKYLESASKPPK